MPMKRKVRYELMTPDEIIVAREACPVAFVPVGPLEWHGPHLPLGTDGIHAHHVAIRVAEILGGVVLPPLYAGTETIRLPGDGPQQLACIGFGPNERITGMDFPGFPVKSLYYEEGTFAVTVREVVRLLKREPFRMIVILNGHGAVNHQRALRRLAVEESDPPRVAVEYRIAWAHREGNADPGHAERWETSILLALEEECVKLSALPPLGQPLDYRNHGIVDGRAFDGRPSPHFLLPDEADPRHSTRQEGERLVEQEVRSLVSDLQHRLDQVLRPASA